MAAQRRPALTRAGGRRSVIVPDGLVRGSDDVVRCWWAGDDERYGRYHDEEWGVPIDDDRVLFELLCLEGFQAGLSWITILRKRPAFRAAFADFDMDAVASFTERDVERLLGDAGIVRHRGKITAAIGNARCALDLIAELGSLSDHVWSFAPPADGRPVPIRLADVAATSPGSVALSRDLKARGWRFVGPTTVYAFMQSMGLVDDHLADCWARGRNA